MDASEEWESDWEFELLSSLNSSLITLDLFAYLFANWSNYIFSELVNLLV